MPNSHTPHSRRLRAEASARRGKAVQAAGGRRLYLILQPDAACALKKRMAETGETATAVISRLLTATDN